MQLVTVLCILVVAGLASAGEDTYTDRFDNVDVHEILNNKRLLITYLTCILEEKAKCTTEGRELKSNIKEALETYCKKCTKVQFNWTRLVIAHLINHEPAYWDKLVAKYDPDHKYTQKYENELREIKG
ncbi:allergen Tha p 1-like [Maniola hyperantus]|uniref:allergen Tha p 1-like n=1 Tax=Aphantopus hyperantus TaxID=2795564 RepID=UPI00156A21CC|nr:allergen Tha p 1-like [Maniola hyperantus]